MSEPERSIANLPALVEALPAPEREAFLRIFHLTADAADLVIPAAMLPFVEAHFGGADAVLDQTVVKVTNLITLDGALFNPLRQRRPHDEPPAGGQADIPPAGPDDPFCAPLDNTTENTFGRVRGTHSITAANLLPIERYHSVVIFDEHHPLAFTEESVGDAMDTALAWARLAHSSDADARYFMLFWNCLWRAAASRIHGHMQAILGKGMHYAQVEALRRAALLYGIGHGSDYFADLCAVHEALGLGEESDGVHTFAYLTPKKEKEIWIVGSRPDAPFKRALYRALAAYRDRLGVQSFNMALLWRPIDSVPEDWSGFPAIARLVDRGPLQSKLSDIGAMELFGSSVISSDPFRVADALMMENR
jgi:hypothetical protein